ncbi:MAG: EAL domain-containing protein [Eubacterium sp.]|nr:EAL domain-containing protein [Eubacterium sp.]
MKKMIRLLLLLIPAFLLLIPVSGGARQKSKTVRVGWYDSTFNTIDETGRRSGYAYEYQLKVAAYTGWNYEYVNGSWPELLKMLERGEIDLMSDVSYMPEREKKMFFPSFAMGTEEYYLFIAPENREISSMDFSSLNGKKVGVNKDSIQENYFREWAADNGIRPELVEMTCSEDESLGMLESGKLDAYVTVDFFTDPVHAVPVFKVGSSDFYFAVNKNRPDLLNDLNVALSMIQDENRYYNLQMYEKFFKRTGANTVLTNDEIKWLSSHGKIRVGYQDNYLAFCAEDKETGRLTGVMKDYLDYASDCLANAKLDFEATAFPTVVSAMDALQKGEVDCVFPVNFSGYDGESMGVIITSPLMDTEIYAVVRQSDQKVFTSKAHIIAAVNEGNPNYDSFLLDNFPEWKKVYYPTTEDCLKAVSDRLADCVLISNYRYNNISRLCKKYHLTTITTGVGLDYSFAVGNGDRELYSILSKVVGQVPNSTVNAALTYYTTEDARLTISDFIVDNLTVVMAGVGIVLLLILTLMIQSMRSEKKAKKLISATEIDELTGLYNRDYFLEYADRMYHDHPDTPMDAIVLNIEQFHSVNALNGREFGDQVLRILGAEIREISEEAGGIAGRFGADRFDIYCRHREDYPVIFDRLQARLDGLAPNASIRLRMGVMPWQAGLEPVQLFDRARTACNMARGHYKEHLIIFDEKVRDQEMYNQRLLNDLRQALDSYEFEVHYQPKYDIQADPPRMVSAEALVRWCHPELGMIPPDDFIPLFERNGQIGLVDKYVWEEAARQIVRWREQYGITIPVSVNVSRVDVFDPMLESTLDGILSYYGLDHDALRLEMTESAYTENADEVIRVVEGLRRKGYEVEMDDFGTGYSSLNMLSSMPIDVLKMDRAFIQNIEHNEKDVQLVALIIDIAKNLKIPVVAEGVETEEQMRRLKALGCSLVQGYYFSRPLHASDFGSNIIQSAR